MEDEIPRGLQHHLEMCYEKGGCHGRQACMIWRWFYHGDVISGCMDLYMTVTNSIVFHFPLYSTTGILWYNWIISFLNSSSFGTYTFLSFSTRSPSNCYSSSLNTLIHAFFISSTTLTISSFLPLAFFIFSTIFTFGPSITTLCKLHNQQSLINI